MEEKRFPVQIVVTLLVFLFHFGLVTVTSGGNVMTVQYLQVLFHFESTYIEYYCMYGELSNKLIFFLSFFQLLSNYL